MQPGEVIDGKYELVRKLGEGAMGAVWEGRHQRLGRRVALKFVIGDWKQNQEIVDRFQREARAAAAIDSEHIVEVTDVGELDDGTPFLVMEYLEGEDLSDLLDRVGRLPPGRAASYVIQACIALSKAHGRGIVHRDLKPANVFLTRREDGSELIKILDFGIAKVQDSLGPTAHHLTSTGVILGTPYYMSPEQAMGAKQADALSDVYALGVILYELLTGRVPFTAESYNELIVKISTVEPPPPRQHTPELDEALEDVVLWAMCRDREERIASASRLALALLPFADEPRLEAALTAVTGDEPPPVAPLRRAPEPRDRLESATTLSSSSWMVQLGRRRSKLWSLTIVAVLLVGALSGLGLYFIQSTPGAEAERPATAGLIEAPPPETPVEPAQDLPPIDAAVEASPGADGAVETRSETIELRVQLEPATAELLIDDIPIEGQSPFIERFPRDGARHRVTARARGHHSDSRSIAFDRDRELSLRLRPRRSPRPRPRPQPPEKRPRGPLERDNPYGSQ